MRGNHCKAVPGVVGIRETLYKHPVVVWAPSDSPQHQPVVLLVSASSEASAVAAGGGAIG